MSWKISPEGKKLKSVREKGGGIVSEDKRKRKDKWNIMEY